MMKTRQRKKTDYLFNLYIMKLQITAHGTQEEIQFSSLQKLRRVMAVLRDAGFTIELSFTEKNPVVEVPQERIIFNN